MYNLITIGDAVMDTHIQIDNASVECDLHHENCKLCLDFASKIPITGSFQAIGGNGANVAVGATKLGLKTAFISSVGNDTNGTFILKELKDNGVCTDYIDTDKKSETRYSVVLNFKGERTILSYHRKKNYVWPKNLQPADWFYYTGLSEGFEILQEKMLAYLEKHPSLRLAFNPGSHQLKASLKSVQEVIRRCDVLVLNKEEAEKILNTTLAKEKSMETLIHKLIILGAKEVAITDAANGAWAGNEEEIWQMKSLPIEVVAKTGAGDAFSSGYMSARCLGHDIETALSWGVANSCGVISCMGAQTGLLDQKGIQKLLKKYSTVQPSKT